MPRWSPDGTSLAFVRVNPRSGAGELYVLPVRGTVFGGARRLTSTGSAWGDVGCAGDAMTPVWSPNSRRIAFECSRGPFRSRVFAVAADGRRQVKLPWADRYADTSPAWTSDGASLSFTRVDLTLSFGAPGRSTVWREAWGLALGPPSPLIAAAGAVGQAMWSPVGPQVAYVARDELTLVTDLRYVDGARGTRTLYRAEPGESIFGLAWSKNGDWLAFAHGDGLRTSTIQGVRVGDGAVLALSSLASPAFAPAWSSSGILAFDGVAGTLGQVEQVSVRSMSNAHATDRPIRGGYTFDAHWRPQR
jgi:Tol biopolymer transport system component